MKSGSRLVSSCAVNAHFTGFAAHSIIYLSSSKSVVFDEFGVVNGVVDYGRMMFCTLIYVSDLWCQKNQIVSPCTIGYNNSNLINRMAKEKYSQKGGD